MKTLTTVSWMSEADLLCSRLATYGIKTNIPDQSTASVLPLLGNAMGGIRIQVNDEDFDKAVSTLREIQSTSTDNKKTFCPKCGSSKVKYRRESWMFFACLIIFMGIPLLWLKKKFHCNSCGFNWCEDPLGKKESEFMRECNEIEAP
ncbi:MAG: DUF2007 domain-containing protein [Kiritimatiellae bacterium]|nr:DUF2007 domain-containing protein [Kiritimatiellia bacterium]